MDLLEDVMWNEAKIDSWTTARSSIVNILLLYSFLICMEISVDNTVRYILYYEQTSIEKAA